VGWQDLDGIETRAAPVDGNHQGGAPRVVDRVHLVWGVGCGFWGCFVFSSNLGGCFVLWLSFFEDKIAKFDNIDP